MMYSIPTEVAELKLIYRNNIETANRPKIQSSKDAFDILFANWDEDSICLYEEFYILLLDRQNNVLGKFKVSQGGMTGTVVDAKLIFATALKSKSNSIILAHNHPSGQIKPSKADIRLTEKIVSAGKFLDLPILDHIIITTNGYYSFADEGLIND